MDNTVVVGADEAGRGLVIGSMVIGACAIDNQIAKKFKFAGIKDSKRYTSIKKIHDHADYIRKYSLAWNTQVLTARVLTNFNHNGMTMDEAEAYGFFRALENISEKIPNISAYQVDNFQAVEKLEALISEHPKLKNIKLTVMPKAESKYISVSGGSILARSDSLKEQAKLQKTYGPIGSGSTSDIKTIDWLKKYYSENRTWPPIVRTYWKTITKIEKEINSKK